MNIFREIQPTQAIIPPRKIQDTLKKKQQEEKKNKKDTEQDQSNSEHKIDEFI